jgi:hypothetical protein
MITNYGCSTSQDKTCHDQCVFRVAFLEPKVLEHQTTPRVLAEKRDTNAA